MMKVKILKINDKNERLYDLVYSVSSDLSQVIIEIFEQAESKNERVMLSTLEIVKEESTIW